MAEAQVGDDVYGEDPAVAALEQRAASILGKEAALFMPSGTMANLAAVLTWCTRRGSEVILGDQSHVHVFEQGGIAQLGGVSSRQISTRADGTLDLDEVERGIRSSNIHFPATELISIENTHSNCGGRVLPVAYMRSLEDVAKRHGLPIHLDGARIWNAATATGSSVQELVASADSVTACLSKGLGAPVGSMLSGTSEFVAK